MNIEFKGNCKGTIVTPGTCQKSAPDELGSKIDGPTCTGQG